MRNNQNSERLQFVVQMRSITHLGRKLYDNLAAALTELVANSWDVYAKNVNITIEEDKITFEDDGIGMSYDELITKYCPIGKEKDLTSIIRPDAFLDRPPMGKKGIGKLAAFSVGNMYSIITKTHNETTVRRFELCYNKMKSYNGPYDVDVNDVTDSTEYFKDSESGFVVEITSLWKKITDNTIRALRKRITRRFSILSDGYDFNVTINEEAVKFDDSYITKNIQYLWLFSNNNEEKINLKALFKQDNGELIPENIKYYDGKVPFGDDGIDIEIYGWIGTFHHSGNNKTPEGDNLNFIQVMHNNKVADENFLRKITGSEIARNYITGKIHANFISELDDPITSSRQGLDDAIPEIEALVTYLQRKYNTIANY